MSSVRNAKDQVKSLVRGGIRIGVLVMILSMMLPCTTINSSAAGRPPTATPVNPTPLPTFSPGCTSTADCVSKMTLDEKIGQMTQVEKNALTTPSDIATYYLGSLLSGGGEGPNGAGGTATEWANMYDNFQSYALQTRLKIPLIYGVDAVHGHNN